MFFIKIIILLNLVSADITNEEFLVEDKDNIEDQEARMLQFGIVLRKKRGYDIYPDSLAPDDPSKEINWITGKLNL